MHPATEVSHADAPAKRRKEEVGATRALTKGAELLIQK